MRNGLFNRRLGVAMSESISNSQSERIVIAMSGGVDSSVAAALLAEDGRENDWRDDAAFRGRVSLLFT